MKTVLRNLMSVLCRFKLATGLNLLGLSVAFAAFMLIMMQVDHEWSFDHHFPTADRIFRVDRMWSDEDRFGPVVPRAYFDAVAASSPHVETSSLVSLMMGKRSYLVIGEAEKRGYQEEVVFVYPDFYKLFGLEVVEGDLSLADPEKVIIPESMARRMFGTASAVGQMIHSKDDMFFKGSIKDYTVGGVYKDLPVNTQLENCIYTALDSRMENDWFSQNCLGYVLLDSPESAPLVAEHFNATFDHQAKYGEDYGDNVQYHLVLTPLTEIYYMPEQAFNKTGNRNTLRLLILIALLVIVVAGINYVNFSTSLTPLRIRSINTQKVLGSSDGELRFSLMAEAVVICLLAALLALGFVAVLNHLELLSFIEADTLLEHHLGLVALLFAIAAGVGLVAGIYPAWYMTSFPPALVLKGSFGLSSSGRKLRMALIGFQYVVSIGLIIGSSFIRLQNDYMRRSDLGFDTDQMAIVKLSTDFLRNAKDTYVNKLKSYPGIGDVAFSDAIIGGNDDYSMMSHHFKGEEFYCYHSYVSADFPETLGLKLTEGRFFNHTDESRFQGKPDSERGGDSLSSYLITRSLAERLGMKAGDRLESGAYVAGIVEDVQAISLREQVNNHDFAFILRYELLPVSYVRLRAGTDVEEALAHIRRTVEEIDPTYPLDIRFYDQVYDQLYQKEQYMKRMITLFSLLAILLSIVGVFGLVVFETQYRRKEIGIRKVYGATVREILVMFNKVYMRIVAVCFVIAAPLAWYGITRWLENFTYRTPLYWWVFALSLLIVLTITLATVTFQNWRAANANPVESIKNNG